jgi:hypothetical protein
MGILLVLAACCLSPSVATSVTFDARSLKIDGQRQFWFAGSAHYPRFTEAQWPIMFARAKEFGLNAITTYVFWNVHQPHNATHYDFSGRKNITKFLDAAKTAGIWIHLRVGPYIDGEWFNGGLPWWLREIDGIQPRSNEPKWKVHMEAWVRKLMGMMGPHLASNGGPVVMWQIENELSGHIDYAKWSIQLAKNVTPNDVITFCNNSGSATLPDFENVIYTGNAFCWGDGVCDPNVFFEEWGHWRAYPSQPAIWSEVEQGFLTFDGSGWFSPPPSIVAHNLGRFYSLGGSGSSYYMFDGGNDFELTAGDNQGTVNCVRVDLCILHYMCVGVKLKFAYTRTTFTLTRMLFTRAIMPYATAS